MTDDETTTYAYLCIGCPLGCRLEVDEDNSVRDGYLIGVDRQIGDNLQFGVGYNFADFSDDLRILDYQQKGWYINLVGKI